MQWNSISEFAAMGGYGFYVWVSFGVTAICMILELIAVGYRHAEALKQQGMAGGAAKA